MALVSGRCLCGKIHYSSDGDVRMTAVCHCKSCQLETGSAFAVMVVIERKTLRIDEGALKSYTRQGGSGQAMTTLFCGDCGTAISHESARSPDLAFISAGTLDDPSWVKPSAHIWCEEKQPWVEIPAGVPQFARNPG